MPNIPTPEEYFKIPSPTDYKDKGKIPSPDEYFSKKKRNTESTSEVQASESKEFKAPVGISAIPVNPFEQAALGQPPIDDVVREQPITPKPKITTKSINPEFQDQTVLKENWKQLKSSVLRTGGALYGLPGLVKSTAFEYIQKPILKALGTDDNEIDAIRQMNRVGVQQLSERVQQSLNKAASGIEYTMKQYESGIVESLQNKDYASASRQLLKGFTGTLPYLALVGASAGGGTAAVLTTMGTTSASQRKGELEEGGGMKEIPGKKLANAWLYGGLEAAGELFTAGIFNNFRRALSGASKEIIQKTSQEIAGDFVKEFLGEGASEGATELGQQLTDYFMGQRDNIDMKQVGDNIIIGSFAVGPISGTTAIANKIKGSRIAPKEDIQKVQENNEKILDLQDKLDDTDNAVIKQTLSEQIDGLQKESNDVIDNNVSIASTLTKDEFNAVERINKAIDENELSIAAKKEKEQDVSIEKEITKELQKKRDVIISEAKKKNVEPSKPKVETEVHQVENIVSETLKTPEKVKSQQDIQYEESMSKKSPEVVAQMPEFRGKKFSLATILPNGDISNVYVRSEGESHKTYMTPQDAEAYEGGKMTIGFWSPTSNSFIEAPQKGRAYGQKVMDIAASKVNIPQVEPKISEEPTNAERIRTETQETGGQEELVGGEEGRIRVRDDEKNRVEAQERIAQEAPQEVKYNSVQEITDALSRGEITTQEHQKLTQGLHKKNFDLSKDRLRDALGGLANIKQAVGDEAKNNFVEVYDALVDFIKNAINVYGDKIRSARDVAKYTGVEYNKAMQEAYDEATGKRIVSNEQKMRGFPKRIKEFQSFKDLKTDIEANPELRYDPQVLSDIKDKIRTMTDEELVKAANPQGLDIISEGSDNAAVLAYLERIERSRAKGEDVMPIIEELSRKGTMWGQLIRQFAEVKGASAEGALTIFEKTLQKMDRYMTEEQRTKFIDLSNKDIDLRNAAREAQEKARILPTDENLKAYDKAKKDAEDAYTEMAKYMQEVSPKNFWDMMGMALQGNLLTPMSQMTNIFANLMNIPITGSANTMASVLDRIHTMVTGSERTTTLDPRVVAYGAKGFVSGAKEALRQIKTGVAISEKAEIQRGFQPWRAMQQAISGEGMAVTKEGKVAWKDRANKFIEGLVGLPAESMFRLLNLGDKPFYRMAEAMTLFRVGKSKGLTGTDLENFVRFPSEKAQALADKAAKEATFQEDSGTSKAATAIANTIRNAVPSGAWRFLMRTQMPYIKTPANIISQTLDIAIPPLSMAKGVYAAYKGNKRESFINFGKAGVGVMMGMAARYLLQHGLMSGSADEEKKIRGLQYDAFPPNSVNLSGLQRLMAGGDPSFQEGDEIVNYTKMGLLGMALGVQANIYETGKELKASDTESKLDDATLRTLSALIEIPSYALEQSFLQGTSTLITAISDKQWDYWLNNTFKAISSIPLPNTLDAANRASREYVPELKGDNIQQRLGNVIRNKLWMTENLPITRNLWGEKILQTPQGSNGWLYQMFNVTKLQELQDKPESKLIYDLYTRTENPDVVPSVPMRRLTVKGEKMELTAKQYERYVELVGKERKRLLQQRMKERGFDKLNDEQKIKTLKRTWDRGQEQGRSIFLQEQE